ncbi:MAG TPA: hypothetical protein VIS07_12725 [Candidatus Binatia bacterium]
MREHWIPLGPGEGDLRWRGYPQAPTVVSDDLGWRDKEDLSAPGRRRPDALSGGGTAPRGGAAV